MKIISFEVRSSRELRLLLKIAKALGIKRVNPAPSPILERVNQEIRKHENGLDQDY